MARATSITSCVRYRSYGRRSTVLNQSLLMSCADKTFAAAHFRLCIELSDTNHARCSWKSELTVAIVHEAILYHVMTAARDIRTSFYCAYAVKGIKRQRHSFMAPMSSKRVIMTDGPWGFAPCDPSAMTRDSAKGVPSNYLFRGSRLPTEIRLKTKIGNDWKVTIIC